MKKHPRLPAPNPEIAARIATTRSELTAAYELAYRVYRDKGYIRPNPGCIVYQSTFGLPSSRTILATLQAEQVVGTLTVVGDNPLGLQLETTFPSEVQSLRERGRVVAEITCLAVRPTDGFRPAAVFFALTQCMIHYAYWRQYDDLLIAIHPRHQRFYHRYYGAIPCGPCRPHVLVRGNPAVPCRIDLHNLRYASDPKLWRQYFSQATPKACYTGPPIQLEDHHYFCHRRGIVLNAEGIDRSVWGKGAA